MVTVLSMSTVPIKDDQPKRLVGIVGLGPENL